MTACLVPDSAVHFRLSVWLRAERSVRKCDGKQHNSYKTLSTSFFSYFQLCTSMHLLCNPTCPILSTKKEKKVKKKELGSLKFIRHMQYIQSNLSVKYEKKVRDALFTCSHKKM